ncbi:MAG TPA: hypothetical protein VIH74_06620 [Candidatus Acidoferrum sp.]
MSVNRISQSHANEAEAVQNVNSQKSQNTARKSDAIEGRNAKTQTQPPAETQPKATADGNAARQQGQEQNTGNDTNGTRVNVFA